MRAVLNVIASSLPLVQRDRGFSLHHLDALPLLTIDGNARQLQACLNTGVVEADVAAADHPRRGRLPLGRHCDEGLDDRPILRPDEDLTLSFRRSETLFQLRDYFGRKVERLCIID